MSITDVVLHEVSLVFQSSASHFCTSRLFMCKGSWLVVESSETWDERKTLSVGGWVSLQELKSCCKEVKRFSLHLPEVLIRVYLVLKEMKNINNEFREEFVVSVNVAAETQNCFGHVTNVTLWFDNSKWMITTVKEPQRPDCLVIYSCAYVLCSSLIVFLNSALTELPEETFWFRNDWKSSLFC